MRSSIYLASHGGLGTQAAGSPLGFADLGFVPWSIASCWHRGALLGLALVDHSRFKLNAGVDLDDEELAEVASALDLHSVDGFFG